MHAWINITHPGFSGRQDMPDDGDQWVSWEQMVATLRAKGEAEGRAALLAREVVELRGEVAKFKPLEMILLKVGDPAQHLSEAVLDLSAKVRRLEEGAHINLRQSIEQRGELEETRAKIAKLEAGAVVVPETDAYDEEVKIVTKHAMKDEWPDDGVSEDCMTLVCWGLRIGIRYANSHAIPADRVLGEGQAAVGAQELGVLRDFAARRMSEREYDRLEELRDAHERSIRASQGGLNHVHV